MNQFSRQCNFYFLFLKKGKFFGLLHSYCFFFKRITHVQLVPFACRLKTVAVRFSSLFLHSESLTVFQQMVVHAFDNNNFLCTLVEEISICQSADS